MGLKKLLHDLFEVSVILKGIYGVTEVVIGGLILFVNHTIVSEFLIFLVGGELAEDPRGRIANQVINYSHHLTSGTEIFVGMYFFTYGIIKIILVIGLLQEKMWSFPTAITFMSFFGFYELYRLTYTHSIILAGLIVFDIITIYLVWHEYGVRKKIMAEVYTRS